MAEKNIIYLTDPDMEIAEVICGARSRNDSPKSVSFGNEASLLHDWIGDYGVTSLSIRSKVDRLASFTLRREDGKHEYWSAYCFIHGRTNKRYVGERRNITLDHIICIAQQWAWKKAEEKPKSPPPPPPNSSDRILEIIGKYDELASFKTKQSNPRFAYLIDFLAEVRPYLRD